jgi:hypothetical protein
MFGKNCTEALGVLLSDPGSQIWHWANLRLANGHVKSTSMSSVDTSNGLHEELEGTGSQKQSSSYRSSTARPRDRFRFSLRGDRWFHAASTIKVASSAGSISSGR